METPEYQNQGQSQSKSRYKVGMHEKTGRVSIVDKTTDTPIESFADNTPEGLLIQRMYEIREEEIIRNKLVAGTSLEYSDSGIIIPDQPIKLSQIIV